MRKKNKWIGLTVGTIIAMTAASMTGCGTEYVVNTETEVTESIDEAEITASILLSDDQTTVDGSGVTVEEDGKITITTGGTYEFKGDLSEGRIVVDASGQDVKIILNGVTLTSSEKDAIFIKEADQAVILLAEGSENILTSGTEEGYTEGIEEIKAKQEEAAENSTEKVSEGTEETEETISEESAETKETESEEPDEAEETLDNNQKAVIFSKCDLQITGSGSLTVNGYINNGIQSKDNLTLNITGKISVAALNDGIKGNDELTIASGTYEIDTYGDAMMAGEKLTIEDGIYTISTGGGASESVAHTKGEGMPGGRPPVMNGEEMPQMPDVDQQSDMDDQADQVSQKAIKSDGSITINGGTFTIDSTDDAIHGTTYVTINGGMYKIKTGDDGIHADLDLVINDGSIEVEESYEGIEGATIQVEGGSIHVVTSDDGFNASSDSVTPLITINGGTIYINSEGDGLDSNENLVINGGEIYVDGPSNGGNAALDVGSENGGILQINGGEVVAIGMSGMVETVDESSTQQSLLFVFSETVAADTQITVTDSAGASVAEFTLTKDADCVVLSNDQLKLDEVYTFTYGENKEEITADELCTTNFERSERGMGFGMNGRNPGMNMKESAHPQDEDANASVDKETE